MENYETEKIEKTVLEMFSQRGYKNTRKENNCILAEYKSEENGKDQTVCLFLTIIEQFKIDNFKNYIALLNKKEIKHGIVLYKKITAFTKTAVHNTSSLKILLETFQYTKLLYNITKHYLVPKHIRLSRQDAINFKKKHGTKIPKMISEDPVVKFYAFKKGDVIEIHRSDEVTYRIIK